MKAFDAFIQIWQDFPYINFGCQQAIRLNFKWLPKIHNFGQNSLSRRFWYRGLNPPVVPTDSNTPWGIGLKLPLGYFVLSFN